MTRLKAKGKGSAFPGRRQPVYWKSLGEKHPRICAACGGWPALLVDSVRRCHVHAQGRGGTDWFNVNGLCGDCDRASEKRPDEYIRETGNDLWGLARSLTVEHFREMNYPEFCVAGPSGGCSGDVEDGLCFSHGIFWSATPALFLDTYGRGFKPLEEELNA